MRLIAEILFVFLNIIMAYAHAEMIEDGRRIRHGIWGGGYLLIAVAVSFLNQSWLLFLAALLIRKVVFDISLNLFRGLPMFYVSSTTTSIIDKLHNRFFGKKSEIYMTVYFVAIIVVTYFLMQ